MKNLTCNKCGKAASSPLAYKCDVCGDEAADHDESHECGGSHCVINCSGCNESETKCTC